MSLETVEGSSNATPELYDHSHHIDQQQFVEN